MINIESDIKPTQLGLFDGRPTRSIDITSFVIEVLSRIERGESSESNSCTQVGRPTRQISG